MTRNLEAEAAYRAAWTQWCLTANREGKLALESVMDGLQSSIADNPKDPRWQTFIYTLPGYIEFWAQFDPNQHSIDTIAQRIRALP